MAAASAGLVAFINELEGRQLETLFTQPYATVALMRSLQPLARQVLARLVCTGGAISSGRLRAPTGLHGAVYARLLKRSILDRHSSLCSANSSRSLVNNALSCILPAVPHFASCPTAHLDSTTASHLSPLPAPQCWCPASHGPREAASWQQRCQSSRRCACCPRRRRAGSRCTCCTPASRRSYNMPCVAGVWGRAYHAALPARFPGSQSFCAEGQPAAAPVGMHPTRPRPFLVPPSGSVPGFCRP